MISPAPCSECGSALDVGQRYCVSCGNTIDRFIPIGLGTRPAIERPARKSLLPVRPYMATTYAAAALGFGIIVGTGITPTLSEILAAPAQIVSGSSPAPPPVASTATPGGGGGGGGGASAAIPGSTPSASFATDSGGSGGGSKKKKKKKKKHVPSITGTVVHVNPYAGSYMVAKGDGKELTAIHAAQPPQPGAIVQVDTKKLKNGTFSQKGKLKRAGTSASGTFTGIVTFRDEKAHLYTVSARGSSVLVHALAVDPTTSQPAPPPPALGSQVQVAVSIDPPSAVPAPTDTTTTATATTGTTTTATTTTTTTSTTPAAPTACDQAKQPGGGIQGLATLTETSVTVLAPPSGGAVDVEGVVKATCANPNLLVVSADDSEESGRRVVLNVPADIDATRLPVGQAVELSAALSDSAPYSLLGAFGDSTAAAADDESGKQGTI